MKLLSHNCQETDSPDNKCTNSLKDADKLTFFCEYVKYTFIKICLNWSLMYKSLKQNRFRIKFTLTTTFKSNKNQDAIRFTN